MNPVANDLTQVEQLQQQNAELEQQNKRQARELADLQLKLKWYEEQIRLAQHKRFGASSEKTDANQLELQLFNEAEVTAAPAVQTEPDIETISYSRRKASGKREVDLSGLPVEQRFYRLSEDEQVCACCGGTMHVMSTETRRELQVIPAQLKVIESIREIGACRLCSQTEEKPPIVAAAMPTPAFPGSLASPSAVAHVMHQKYVNAQPLYRQEAEWLRMGYPLSRQTMANWMIAGSERWLEPIYAQMKRILVSQDVLHADESTLQVLQEPGKAAQSESYMWVYLTGRESEPIVLYEYQRTRGGEHPRNFLSGFQGYLHVDGYPGYHKVQGVKLSGCWAHARRYYDEALKSMPPSARTDSNSVAAQGLAWCNQLYAIERDLREKTPEERFAARLKQSQPILDDYFKWLRQQKTRTMPKSALGKAIAYSLNQWEKLTTFMKDGQLELDNNRAERSIKPFVTGRKNWLFANTPRGAKSSAIIFSVIETAKQNGLNPFHYLAYLFEQLPLLPNLQDPTNLAAYLPWSAELPAECRIP
jgi:transposase